MRKWFWCCAAAGVVAAGIFGTVKYCGKHPDSPVTRAVASVCEIGLRTTPLTGLQSAPAGAEDGLPGGIPADPVPCDDSQAEPKPVVQIDLPGNTLEIPAPLVIREDTDLKEPVVTQETVEVVPSSSSTVAVEWSALPAEAVVRKMPHCEEEPLVVAHMPYADEDLSVKRMPYAEEEVCAELGLDGGCLTGLWVWILEDATLYSVPNKAECCESMTLWRKFVGALKGEDTSNGSTEEAEPKKESECREDPHSHQHYHGCPYTGGYPFNDHRYCPRPIPIEEPKAEPAKGGEEQSEPKSKEAPKKFDIFRFFKGGNEDHGMRPLCPRIDTMEFRRTDRTLDELEPGTL